MFSIIKFALPLALIQSRESEGLNEFDLVEGFIKKYINKIEPDKRQYVFAYNAGRLEFERGNYSEALEKLGKSGSIKNVFYKAAIKQLTLMIYYELQWLVPAADLLDAYRHFISRFFRLQISN